MKSFNSPANICMVAVLGCLVTATPSVHAADYIWAGTKTGKPSDWFSAKNWKKIKSSKLAPNSARIATVEVATTSPGAGDTATITDGAIVAIDQPVTLAALRVEENSTVRGAGDITITSSLTLEDARLVGEGDINIPSNATATLSSQESGTATGSTINKVIENSGVVEWTSGDLTLQKNFRNLGDFNIKSNDSLKPSGMVTAILENEGTLIKTAIGGDAAIEVPFANSGDVYLRGGSLEVGPAYVQDDGSLNLDGGNLSSVGKLRIDGGELKGTGLIDCDVVQNGGTFKPGHSPGIITINGNYTQASSAFLDMEIGGIIPGAQHDQMVIWGVADMNGTLDILKYNSFIPTDGDTIELIRYMSGDTGFKTITGKYPGGSIYYIVVKMPAAFFACAVADNTDPTLAITSPIHSLTYQGVNSVKGICTDLGIGNSGVKVLTVRFYRYASGSIPAGYWLGGSSWSTNWSSANELVPSGVANWTLALPPLPPGKYLTRATATDNVGNSVITPNVIFIISSTSGSYVKNPELMREKAKPALVSLPQPRKFFVSSRI